MKLWKHGRSGIEAHMLQIAYLEKKHRLTELPDTYIYFSPRDGFYNSLCFQILFVSLA